MRRPIAAPATGSSTAAPLLIAAITTVSLIFTDLVGSTALASSLGPTAAEELRQEHFALLRSAIQETGGREVKNLGDGLMVACDSAVAAAECAVAMQQRVAQRNRRAQHELLIRIGIALGEADYEEGDYFGPPVVEAARLCAHAAGGQILCGGLLHTMASSRSALPFTPLGPVELKGLAQPVDAYELGWAQAAASTEPQLPPRLREVPTVGYVGRAKERELLGAMWRTATGGALSLALLSGEPGIGKTRLATHVALGARSEGAAVLYGRCDEDLGVPYQPWVEALASLVEGAPDPLLDDHVRRHGGELVRLVPALQSRVSHVPQPRRSDAETERYMLFAAVVGLLSECSAERPLVVILDDLHWADKPTLALLLHLVRCDADMRVLIIATYRASDLSRGHPLQPVLADLRRENGIERIALTGLEDVDVVAVMEAAAGHELTQEGLDLARAVTRETDGNPFFVAELLRHLVETGALTQGANGRWTTSGPLVELGLPESVREVIGRRIERLGEDTGELLSLGAVIGRDFDLQLLARVTGRDEDEVLEQLESAVAASLLTEDPRRPGRFMFAHALINHTLYEGLGPTRRARAHRLIAAALEDLAGEDPGPRLGELAHHWAEATESVALGKAVSYAQRAGEYALAQLAPDEAARWFTQALELTPRGEAAGGLRCDLLTGLGDAQRQTGDPAFRETLLEASRLALEGDDDQRLARAVLANNRGHPSAYGDVDAERVDLLQAALNRVGSADATRRARLLALLSLELLWEPDFDHRRSLSDEAVELARQSGDARVLAQVLRQRVLSIWAPGTERERIANIDELLTLAERLGDPVLRFWACFGDVDVRMETAQVQRAEERVAECLAIAAELRQPTLTWAARYHQAGIAIMNRPLPIAEQLADAALEAGTESGEPDAALLYGTQIALIQSFQARHDEVIPNLEAAVEGFPQIPTFAAGLGLVYLDAGRPDDAHRMLHRVLSADGSRVPRDPATTSLLALCAEIAGRLDDREAAARLYDQIAGLEATIAWNPWTSFGPLDFHRGVLAATLGHQDEADALLHAALELTGRLHDAPMAVRIRLCWGEILCARGRPDDVTRAREHFQVARELAVEHVLPTFLPRAEAGLAAAPTTR